MSLGKTVLVGLGLYSAYYYAKLAFAGSDLQIIFKGFSIQNLSQYKITLTCQNTSNTLIVLNSLSAAVSINGNNLGQLSNFQGGVNIPPNAQTDVDVFLNISYFSIPSIMTNFIQNLKGTYDIAINGTINANGVVYPINIDNVISF